LAGCDGFPLQPALGLRVKSLVMRCRAFDDALDREPARAHLHAENRVRPAACSPVSHFIIYTIARA